ncbi:class I SAM-dependent methyltransferase [Haladaptatus sp. F3-133]|jgi:predicted O-methyltransferase YrrM|uniref:Class I SAM-dependent methyltransferase n=1 Tax=Halorutilus salinus TaxID=2487751 RepID=A0A9Q4C758_9EURY|nr:class I SAM-dependent methyltransferase [Halorutilus salinus]MCX2819654.1 class I SAM-dependent methyltransferase [Halorutilus salinus]
MVSKLGTVKRILRNKSMATVAEKGALYLATYLTIQSSYGDRLLYSRAVDDLRRRTDEEDGLEDILDTVLEVEPGSPFNVEISQIREEIRGLAEVAAEHEPQNVLEIGTLRGGTFYVWCRHLDTADHLVSLDLPGRDLKTRRDDLLTEFAPSKDVNVVRGNSHDDETFERVADTLDEPVDFLFIDGDHTYEGVKDDFGRYRKLAADDAVVAFHDIVPHAETRRGCRERLAEYDDLEERHVGVGHPDWGVSEFWDELVENASYETEEIVAHPKQFGKGIGVVYL